MEYVGIQEILDRNLKVMKKIEKKEKNEYDRYRRDFDVAQSHLEKENNFINFNFNLNKDGSRRILFASSIPAAVATFVTALGLVGVVLPTIPLIMAHGEVGLTDAHIEVLNKLEEFIGNAGTFSLNGLKALGVSLIAPALYGAVAIPKTMLDDMKLTKGAEAEDIMPFVDDLLLMLEDLRVGREDISLNFIRSFLSNVDISKNKSEFNLELLYRLSEYRTSVLKECDGVAKDGESSEAFMGVIDYLNEAGIENGASKRFLSSPYVMDLLNTYAPVEEENINIVGHRK